MGADVNNINKNLPCLIINKSTKNIWCVCEKAFDVADLIWLNDKKIKKDIGSYVICKNKPVRKIKSIRKISLFGKSFKDKFFSFLNGIYSLDTRFEEIKSISVGEIKDVLIEIIYSNQYSYDFDFIDDDIDKARTILVNMVNKAKTLDEIIEAFHCNNENCLDSL